MSAILTDTRSILEIVVFRLVPGADRSALPAAVRETDAWLARQPGFLGRTLTEDPAQGVFVDIGRWTGRAEAEAAGATFMEAPESKAFERLIDPATVQMYHVAPFAG